MFLVIGFLIFWRLWGASNELPGLLTSFIFVTIGETGITDVFAWFSGPPNPFLQIVFFISGNSFFALWPCLAAFSLTFPKLNRPDSPYQLLLDDFYALVMFLPIPLSV